MQQPGGTDIEQWYWDEMGKLDDHAQQLETMLRSHIDQLRRSKGGFLNAELGIGLPKYGEISKAARCLNHAARVAEYTQKLSTAARPANGTTGYSNTTYAGIALGVLGLVLLIVGIFVMSLSSFWVGVGLSIAGIVLMLIGLLLFIGSKRWVFATITGIGLGIFLVAFVVLLVVLI